MGLRTLNPIFQILEAWNEEQEGPVRLYDFGDGQTNMPIPDPVSGSYLTSSICMLYVQGKGQLPKGMLFPRAADGIQELGDGWKFVAIEIGYQWTPEQMLTALVDAKEKLLAAR